MKPNILIMQAFGPFATTQTLDFDLLGSNPLFLINGPTGSGKSSILDAICFALYGQTTGKEREASQMRCDHAPDTLLTEITLEFTFRKQRYRIIRSPTQLKAKARGEGTTTHQTTAQLWKLSLTESDEHELLVPKNASEVTQAVIDLTGLNVEQFRQVMVLPQGKFRDFLLADSSQREAIFSQLFQTDIYQRIENTLKKRAATIRKEVEGLNNQIKGLLQGADVSTEDELNASLIELKQTLQQHESSKTAADKALAEAQSSLDESTRLVKDFQLLEQDKQQQISLQEQQAEINAIRVRLEHALAAQKIQPYHMDALKQAQDKQKLEQLITKSGVFLTDKQQAVEQARVQFDQAEIASKELDALKAEVVELKQLVPKVQELEQATQLQQQQNNVWQQAKRKTDQADESLNTVKQAITQTESKVVELEVLVAGLADKQGELERLLILGKQRAQLDRILEKQVILRQELSHKKGEVTILQQTLTAANTQANRLAHSWHSNQAALLAAELNQSEPCPVCGSTEHPALAVPTQNEHVASKDEVETARDKVTQLQTQLAGLESHIQALEKQLIEIESEVVAQQQALGEDQNKSTNQLRTEWKQLDVHVKELKSQADEIAVLNQALVQKKTEQQQCESLCEQTRSQAQEVHETWLLAQQTTERLQQELPEPYRQPNVLADKIKQVEQSIQQISAQQQQAQQVLHNAQKQEAEAQATLAQQKEQFAGVSTRYDEANQLWTDALQASPFVDKADFLNAVLSEEQQQTRQQSVQKYDKAVHACNTRIEQQQQRLADKKKPDIEQQQYIFNELSVQSKTALDLWKQTHSRYDKQQDTQKKLQVAHANNQQLEQEYAIYGTLSDVANGQTGNKISLQRFVISVFLDDVLIEASHRLHIMSKKRYRLIRKQERAKGNKASGLELEVEDAYTGKTRAVSTLSGGESFMAALSLALGLSDRVQSYAGGIKLDTLFIDEGFGSLDQESLDSAIKTLIDLQSSGRMIGIISHVSELREQMKLRVDVKSSPSGSKVMVFGADVAPTTKLMKNEEVMI